MNVSLDWSTKMFVIITNRNDSSVYGTFASVAEATVWAKHHLVGCCWQVKEVCHA